MNRKMVSFGVLAAAAASMLGCAAAPSRSMLAVDDSASAYERAFGSAELPQGGNQGAYAIDTFWRREESSGGYEAYSTTRSFQSLNAGARRDSKFDFLLRESVPRVSVGMYRARRLALTLRDEEALREWAVVAARAIAKTIEDVRLISNEHIKLDIYLTSDDRAVDHAYIVNDSVFIFVARVRDLVAPQSNTLSARIFRGLSHESYHILHHASEERAQIALRKITLRVEQHDKGVDSARTEELRLLEYESKKFDAFEEASAEIFAQCALLNFPALEGRRRDGPLFAYEALDGNVLKERRNAVLAFLNREDAQATDFFRGNVIGYYLAQVIWADQIGMTKDYRAGDSGAAAVERLCGSGAISAPERVVGEFAAAERLSASSDRSEE